MTDTQIDTTTTDPSIETLAEHICAKMLSIAEETGEVTPEELARRISLNIEFQRTKYGYALILYGEGVLSRDGYLDGVHVCTLTEKVKARWPGRTPSEDNLLVDPLSLEIFISGVFTQATDQAIRGYFDVNEGSDSKFTNTFFEQTDDILQRLLLVYSHEVMRADRDELSHLSTSDIVTYFTNKPSPLPGEVVEHDLLSAIHFPRLMFDGNDIEPEQGGRNRVPAKRKKAILTVDLAWIFGNVCMLVSISRSSPAELLPYRCLVGVDGFDDKELMDFFETINRCWVDTDEPYGRAPFGDEDMRDLRGWVESILEEAWVLSDCVYDALPGEEEEDDDMQDYEDSSRDQVPHDPVNAPAHYRTADRTYEPINVIEAWKLDFCLGNSVKYIARAGKKDPDKYIEDLQKAIWFINRRIYQIERGID